jgi:hypothetical protein
VQEQEQEEGSEEQAGERAGVLGEDAGERQGGRRGRLHLERFLRCSCSLLRASPSPRGRGGREEGGISRGRGREEKSLVISVGGWCTRLA